LNTVLSPIPASTRIKLISWFFAKREVVITLMMLVFIMVFSLLTLTKPTYEWDLLPYMANAMQIVQEKSIDELHAEVYQAVQGTVPSGAYKDLLGTPSRLVLSEDSEAFRQTMTFFYDARIIYNHIMAGMLSLGLNPVFAYYFFSTLCVVISLLLLIKLIPARVPIGMHFVMPFIVLAFGLMTVARLATPDALAALTTIALYFLLFRNKVYLLLALLPFVIFIRTDLILMLGLFHAYLLFGNRAAKSLVVLSGVLTIGAYLFLNHIIVDADPWSSLIGYNFGPKPTHPEEYVFPVPFLDYLGYLKLGVLSFSYNPMFFIFCMLTIMGIVLMTARFFAEPTKMKMTTLQADLLFLIVSCMAYFLLHFMLFPVNWTRFFAAQYSLVAVVVCWCSFAALAHKEKHTSRSFEFLDSK